MPATEQILITLPADVLDLVRKKVSSGIYANESEVIQDAIVDQVLPPIHEAKLEHWLGTEVVRRYDAMRADPTRGLSIEEAFSFLEEEK